MIVNTKIRTYSSLRNFLRIENYPLKYICEIMNLEQFEITDFMKENDEEDYFDGVADYTIERIGISDEEIIQDFLEKKEGKFILIYSNETDCFTEIEVLEDGKI